MLHWRCVTQLEQVAVRVQHIVVIRDITAQQCLLHVGVHAVLQMQRVQVVIIQRSYAIRDIIKMVLNPSSGTTSGNGATTITQCYIPSGTKGSDSTGQYEYIGNCYYIL